VENNAHTKKVYKQLLCSA